MAKVSIEQPKRSVNVERYPGLILFAGFLILLALLLSNTSISEQWAFGDLGIPPSDLRAFYDRTFYIWQTEGIGSVGSPAFNVKVVMLFASLVMGSTIVSKVLLLSTFVISYGSCYFLLRKFGIRPLLCFTGASLYSLNPVTIAAFIGGEISEIMTFAIFPAMIYIVYKVFRKDHHPLRSLAVLTMLIFVFVWNIYVAFWYATLIAIPLLLVLFLTKKGVSGTSLKRTAARTLILTKKGVSGTSLKRTAARTLILTKKGVADISRKDVVIRLSIISLIVVAVFAPTIVLIQSKSSAASEVSFAADAEFTYQNMSIDNVLRMAGNTGSAQENLGYNEFSFFALFGSVIVFVAIGPLLLFGFRDLGKTAKIFLISSLVSFALIIALVFIVRSYPSVVDSSLLFASLRNPKKLLFPLVFAITILFTFGANRMVSKANRSWIRHSTLAGLFLCILLYNLPALDGTLGLAAVRNDSYTVDQKYAVIPSLLTKIDPDYKNYRIFVFPWQYNTNSAIHSSLLNYYGTPLGAGADGVNVGEFNSMFKLIGENPASRQSIFNLYNVKHVVIDKNFDRYPSFLRDQLSNEKYLVYYDHESYWATGDPSYLYASLTKDASFVRSYEDSQFAIFTFTGITRPTMLSTVTTTTNLVVNPSFESGTLENWQAWPENLVGIKNNDGVSGIQSIAIQGLSEWWSNANQIVSIEEGATYQLKFAVKPFNTTDMHVKLLWYNQNETISDETALRVDYIRLYEMSLNQGEWNSLEKSYIPPSGANLVDIQLLGSRVRDSDLSTLTLYDDISFGKISLSDASVGLDFASINPTHWWANIDSDGATKLSFAQSYDSRWEARVYKDGFLVETVKPTRFVNVLNSFDITTVGNDLDVHILFLPQSSFEASFIFVAAVVLLATGYLFHDQVRNKRSLLRDTVRAVYDLTVDPIRTWSNVDTKMERRENIDRKSFLLSQDSSRAFTYTDAQATEARYGEGLNANPLVTVAIPTRNSSKTLASCLKAVRNQTYSNIEIIVVDSESNDDTVRIAKKYEAEVISTKWKLLGARYLGCEASKGEYVLLLDSDQILYPDTIERLVRECEGNDMLCLEEMPYNPKSFLEKLFVADRELINSFAKLHLDPIYGVMLARFYRKSILDAAFKKIPIDRLHDVVAHDHAIIYYEAFRISANVGLLTKAVMHKEPTSITELWRKNYRYGKTTRELMDSNLYADLLRRKTRFRKGTSLNFKSLQSFFLLLLKGVPYVAGLKF